MSPIEDTVCDTRVRCCWCGKEVCVDDAPIGKGGLVHGVSTFLASMGWRMDSSMRISCPDCLKARRAETELNTARHMAKACRLCISTLGSLADDEDRPMDKGARERLQAIVAEFSSLEDYLGEVYGYEEVAQEPTAVRLGRERNPLGAPAPLFIPIT